MRRRATLTVHSRRLTPAEVVRNWLDKNPGPTVWTDADLEDMDWSSPASAEIFCIILEIPKAEWPDIAHGIGEIYFVYSSSMKAIKIGFSFDTMKRLKTLQTSSSCKLELLARASGTVKDERALHKSFSTIRLHGEWFKDRAHLRKYIANLAHP